MTEEPNPLDPMDWITRGLIDLEVLVGQQTDNIDRLVLAIQGLAEAVEVKPSKREVFSISVLIAAITLLVSLIMSAFLFLTIQTNKESIALLKSCSVPEDPGDCYEDGQDRANLLVQALINDNRDEHEKTRRVLAGRPLETREEELAREKMQAEEDVLEKQYQRSE